MVRVLLPENDLSTKKVTMTIMSRDFGVSGVDIFVYKMTEELLDTIIVRTI